MKQIKTKSEDIIILSVSEQIPINRPDGIILGKLSELTDKDCEEFVENTVRCNNCYWEDCEDNLKTFVDMSEHIGKEIYYYKGCPNCETDDYLMDISKESFTSLLQSEGIDTSKEYLIIKML